MTTSYFAAEIQDPITGSTITLSANTEEHLDQFITQHLEMKYPAPHHEA